MKPNSYKTVYVHRVVAAKKLGRDLRLGEVVHHLDGNTANNDPNNLEICSSASVHRLHHKRSHLDHVTTDRPLIQSGDMWL
jgi:hypothetical protein